MMLLLKHLMTKDRKSLGKIGEELACRYLRRCGYRILDKNYRAKSGEIDIVALDGKVLVFVEVKTRQTDAYGLPEESINIKKMHKLTRLAQLYISYKKLYEAEARFDVVSILMPRGFGKKSIKLIKNAFSAGD
ncbi:MAG: YraN family protein [Candidatus Omnitrophica bacterium]|nr:YraN family protein [Candidatus Omnitrophota bacterium]